MTEKRFMKLTRLVLEPSDFYENIEWVKSIIEWNHGNGCPLAWHVEHFHIPPILKPVIGKILRGEKLQNNKGKSNQKYTPTERFDVALKLESNIESNKRASTGYAISKDAGQGYLRHYLNTNASPTALYKLFGKYPQQCKKREADRLNVTVATIDKWLQNLRDLKKKWPDI